MATHLVTESILSSVKKIVGDNLSGDYFDSDFVMAINTVLMILWQLGIGTKGYVITGDTETWGDFLGEEVDDLAAVKWYVGMKVKMIFDPPTNGSVRDALEKTISELEWRLNAAVDPSYDEIEIMSLSPLWGVEESE